jgi:DNA-binding FrmR family transcriptional regulator
MSGMEPRRRGFDDRQLDALLERLDAIRDELRTINRRLDSQDTLLRIAAEISTLNDALQALAYAALGRQPPQVRRRRTG